MTVTTVVIVVIFVMLRDYYDVHVLNGVPVAFRFIPVPFNLIMQSCRHHQYSELSPSLNRQCSKHHEYLLKPSGDFADVD